MKERVLCNGSVIVPWDSVWMECTAGPYFSSAFAHAQMFEHEQVSLWKCDHCDSVMERRAVDPAITKCKSCGAPRKML